MDRPFFARFLDVQDMQNVQGGDAGGRPNAKASANATSKNPNAGLVAITLKYGKCGNDCDHGGDADGVFIL